MQRYIYAIIEKRTSFCYVDTRTCHFTPYRYGDRFSGTFSDVQQNSCYGQFTSCGKVSLQWTAMRSLVPLYGILTITASCLLVH
ncbi:hypothetical protein TYRP_018760 [Tyrophagus putrescentiae]|nr:hypothetical protein TYRP_018760 [Tyrophagus putrescentiae]